MNNNTEKLDVISAEDIAFQIEYDSLDDILEANVKVCHQKRARGLPEAFDWVYRCMGSNHPLILDIVKEDRVLPYNTEQWIVATDAILKMHHAERDGLLIISQNEDERTLVRHRVEQMTKIRRYETNIEIKMIDKELELEKMSGFFSIINSKVKKLLKELLMGHT